MGQFDSTIHNYLKKKSPKYDIIIYDPLFTRRFSHYFVDLNDWIPEEHLNQYFGDSAKLGKYKNQWVGLVNIYRIYNIFRQSEKKSFILFNYL